MNLETVQVIEKTVHINQHYMELESFFNVLRDITKEEGFKGFTRINWEVDDLPEITYYKSVNDKTTNKKKSE